MPTETNLDYQKGLDLAEAGMHKEALECIQRYLQTAPDDAEALNDMGAILHCMGQSDEAVNYLEKAKSLKSDSSEITWNLAETYLVTGRAKETVELFDDMEQMKILSADVLNRTADAFLSQDDPAGALEMLNRSLQISPNQEIIEEMIKVVRSKVEDNSNE